MSARFALRDATADHHRRVDGLFSRFDLAATAGYRRFLGAIAAAHLPAEAGLEDAGIAALLPDWPERRRAPLLRRDLGQLGVAAPEGRAPSFAGDAEALGAVYVLEGSRLGGAVLREAVPASAPRSFLHAEGPRGSWRNLTQVLDLKLSTAETLTRAVASAQRLFDEFAAAAVAELETAQ